MILRNFEGREQLDVSGLNKITVLLDRSESELTEIGFNKWTPNQVGPPHNHPEKDQVFFIHSGHGVVMLGNNRYNVAPGDVLYVPSGLVHQTITTEEPLAYVLYNVFNDVTKEGHTTFADHIEKVKGIRKKQAEQGLAGIKELDSNSVTNNPVFIQGSSIGIKEKTGSFSSIELLNSEKTNGFTFSIAKIGAQKKKVMSAVNYNEKAFFVVEGDGTIEIEKETSKIRQGDLFYVSFGMPIFIETKNKGVTMLYIEVNVNKQVL